MSRGLRTLIVMLLAVGMAGLATYGAYRAIQTLPVKQVEAPKTSVVVAAGPLSVGAMIAKENVRVVPWPAEVPVKGGFASIDQVIGRGLVATVAENEPLTETKLAPASAGAGLPPTIPAGMRALSVKVNEVIGVAGFVVPGTKVDLLVTVGSQEESMARTVVSNVLVLAAGSRYDQDRSTKDGKPIPATVVTLALMPDDAEKVVLATSEGRVMLALRNPLDTTPTETRGVRMGALMAPPSAPPQEQVVKGQKRLVAPPPPPPPPKAYTVETIRGAKRSEEVVK